MDLKNRYLIALALIAFLGVQAWLVHQNEIRYSSSEDVRTIKAKLTRATSENELLSNEIANLKAQLEQYKNQGNVFQGDVDVVTLQAAALEKCENRLKQVMVDKNIVEEIPSLDETPESPHSNDNQNDDYPDLDIEEEAKRLNYKGENLPKILNPPSGSDVPVHAQSACDTAWIAPRQMHNIIFFDVFPMNWESEIGFVSNKDVESLECHFEIDGVTKTSRVQNIDTSYLTASLARCTIVEEAKQFLQDNLYLDFKLVNRVTQSAETISVCIPEKKKFYYLANCCIYRNDDNIMDQWLQWQTVLGIEHFFLYDHKSTDLTNKVLEQYVREGRVTYMNWRNNRPEPHDITTYHVAQDSAYLSCTNRFRDKAKWIWTGDTDEFLYTPKEDSVLPLLRKYEDKKEFAGVRAVGYRTADDPNNPLPLMPDPSKQTMLVEQYRLNMSFPEKYQWRSTRYATFKVFVKVKEALYSSMHELAGGGSSIDFSPSDVYFLHYRHERYGRGDSPNDNLVHDPGAFNKFGKKIVLRYAQDMYSL